MKPPKLKKDEMYQFQPKPKQSMNDGAQKQNTNMRDNKVSEKEIGLPQEGTVNDGKEEENISYGNNDTVDLNKAEECIDQPAVIQQHHKSRTPQNLSASSRGDDFYGQKLVPSFYEDLVNFILGKLVILPGKTEDYFKMFLTSCYLKKPNGRKEIDLLTWTDQEYNLDNLKNVKLPKRCFHYGKVKDGKYINTLGNQLIIQPNSLVLAETKKSFQNIRDAVSQQIENLNLISKFVERPEEQLIIKDDRYNQSPDMVFRDFYKKTKFKDIAALIITNGGEDQLVTTLEDTIEKVEDIILNCRDSDKYTNREVGLTMSDEIKNLKNLGITVQIIFIYISDWFGQDELEEMAELKANMLAAEMERIQLQYRLQIKTMEENQSQHKSEIEKMQYKSEMEKMQSQHKSEMEKMELQYKSEKDKINTEVEKIQSQHKSKMEKMELQHKLEIEKMKLLHEFQITNVKSQHKYEMEKMQIKINTEVEKVQQEYKMLEEKRLKEQIQREKEQIQREKEQIQREKEQIQREKEQIQREKEQDKQKIRKLEG